MSKENFDKLVKENADTVYTTVSENSILVVDAFSHKVSYVAEYSDNYLYTDEEILC